MALNNTLKILMVQSALTLGCFVFLLVFVLTKPSNMPLEVNSDVVPPISSETISIDGLSYTIDMVTSGVSYDLLQMSIESPINIDFSQVKADHIAVNGRPVAEDGLFKLELHELKKSGQIEIVFQVQEQEQHIFFRMIPSDFPVLNPYGNSPEEGKYYFTLGNYMVKLNQEGQLLFYKKGNAPLMFRPWNIEGKQYYSYIEHNFTPSHDLIPDVGQGRYQAVVMNNAYTIIDRIEQMSPNGEVPAGLALENHDFHMFDVGHYLLSSYWGKRVTNIPEAVEHEKTGVRVIASLLQEVKDGQVLFQWDSTLYPELYALSVEANDYYNEQLLWSDYAHFNSFIIDPKDSNLICSFRHLDTVLKIDRDTGAIIWRLGGKGDEFGLSEQQKFSRQHNLTVQSDGSYLLFDNGNITNVMGYPKESTSGDVKGQTRVLQLKVNEESKSLLSFNEFKIEKAFSAIMGSATRLDETQDSFLIGWGGMFAASPIFSEINFSTNTVVFELLSPGSTIGTYRVYKECTKQGGWIVY